MAVIPVPPRPLPTNPIDVGATICVATNPPQCYMDSKSSEPLSDIRSGQWLITQGTPELGLCTNYGGVKTVAINVQPAKNEDSPVGNLEITCMDGSKVKAIIR